MSLRNTIISALISYIQNSTGITGYRGMRFLHEINTFPSFYVHPSNETRAHIGDGVVYGVISVSIRGYQWSDSLDAVDAFGRTLETAIQTFYIENRDIVDEARVVSFKTDEGVMEPYGTVDLEVQIVYNRN